MQRFIPITDELLEHARQPHGRMNSRLVPYRVGLPCIHWEILPPEQAQELQGPPPEEGETRLPD